MNVTFTAKGTTSMRSSSNKDNAFSGSNGNYNNDKPQFGGCALVVVLAIVAVVLFTVVIPMLAK